MSKARTLADFISDGSEFADGTISVSEVSGAAPLASPTFTGTVTVPTLTPTTITGGNISGDVRFGTNVNAIFGGGANDYLNIYSDGTNKYIQDTGSGSLFIRGSDLVLEDASGYDYIAMSDTGNGGSVAIKHSGDTKFITAADGVDITGDVGATTATITGKTTTDELDLNAIAATISDTAVDIFVYDTRKDSDGGAWRKRTQHTSWYNETLNTSTRGARKEFPAVAVIVAEQEQITIYDGDDPDLPMWMVCNVSGTNYWIRSGGDTRSLFAMNGILMAGASGGNVGDSLLSRMDFLKDRQERHFDGGVHQVGSNTVAERNQSHNTSYDGGQNIVSRYVNDVAMTVLPNAPIDAATGLPVPTIAVATDGGVSVIRDDGTVVDITRASATEMASVDFYNGYLVIGNSNVGAVWYYDYIPSSDEVISPSYGHIEYYDSGFSNRDVPAYIGYQNTKTAGTYIGTTGATEEGLTAVDFNNTDYTKSSTAWITSNYNTGWMNGDIKLATLSDTDDTDVTGSELVTNGTFDSDVSSWSALQFTTTTTTIAHDTGGDGGRMLVTTTAWYAGANQTITGLTAGATYTATAYIVAGTLSQFYLQAANSSTGSAYASYSGTQTDSYQSITFTLASDQTSVELRVRGNNGTGTFYVDNVSLRLAEEDRSVNGNGLQVFGSITKNPVATGADLVAYSGFSDGTNYLEQPYNSDLDFGTGDFCILGWFKNSSLSDTYVHFLDNGYPNTEYFSCGMVQTSGDVTMRLKDSAGQDDLTTSSLNLDNGTWHQYCFVRRGLTGFIYIDGQAKVTQAISNRNLTGTSGVLSVGVRGDGIRRNNGYLSLWRISATAPSPEQIKKIYEDEKVLFQENAQATLYGSSDAVTALAYDDSTNLLHVGTSAGRSVFQGLRRVDNTTTAVGAAISASNGLVADE